jgi:hypothetical protein
MGMTSVKLQDLQICDYRGLVVSNTGLLDSPSYSLWRAVVMIGAGVDPPVQLHGLSFVRRLRECMRRTKVV